MEVHKWLAEVTPVRGDDEKQTRERDARDAAPRLAPSPGRCSIWSRGRNGKAAVTGTAATAGTKRKSPDLRITSVFWCVARGFKRRASFSFAGCCWWRPLAVDGGSGTSGDTP